MNQRSTAPAEDLGAILHARARALAQRGDQGGQRAGGSAIELLEFRLARDRYAFETRHVGEVLPLRELVPVPCTPPFIAGVVNVRGRITAVIDIRKFFGLASRGLVDLHHVLLVRACELELGVLADTVVGVHAHAREELQAVLPASAGVPADYMLGMTAERVLVLDLPRMLADPRMLVNEEVNP
jgi:purine-binding chemotaxis protein CheW